MKLCKTHLDIRAAFLMAALSAMGITATAGYTKGYFFGNDQAPGGHEWQCPDSLSYNKELPRATFYSFADINSAKRVLPEHSAYAMSLNGDWKFNWVRTPEERPADFYRVGYDDSAWDVIPVPSNWNIVGLQKDGTQKYGKPIYVNQPVIFMHSVKPGDWRGGVMRTPPKSWTTYEDRNEVGSYRRSFDIPASWRGREVYINFDGVDSFFYLWINGKYVGFSKNSRNAARFNITPYLNKTGHNEVAVEVYRSSDGSFFEAQDMFRLPGIFRSVRLTSTPQLQIRDLNAIPDLDANYKDGTLRLTAAIRNLSAKAGKGCTVSYSLYANQLYSDSTSASPVATASTLPVTVKAGAMDTVKTELTVKDPKKWSAEEPWRYTLVAQLKDAKGKVVETVSTYVGFRKVELRNMTAAEDEFGMAGRYLLLNGKPVKFKGVNRHETDPAMGHALTREKMMKDVMLMKRGNINHVRNCHYPDDPYWYYLCDKYGIMLEDEANLESHEYYYGDASLSHVPELEAAHIARDLEMVHSTVNHPSVVIWSLGNEAGPGVNFEKAYAAIKDFDKSRPIQYERNNDIVDIGSNQYPSIRWVRYAVTGQGEDIKYPFHISEYAHSMGNALGNLVDYWEAIESSNHVMGGAIWDWVDQSLWNYDPKTGEKYLAFGGDFGDYPSDGQFVMNGVMFGDLTPKPEYYEVKKVYQNVGVKPVDMQKGQIEIFNKNYFAPMAGYDLKWTLMVDGAPAQEGMMEAPAVPARQKAVATIPYNANFPAQSEIFVNVEFLQRENKPWAEKGYSQMAEQLLVQPADGHALPQVQGGATALPPVLVNDGMDIIVSGQDFKAVFDTEKGILSQLEYGSRPVLLAGEGPRLEAFRAYINNDEWIRDSWFAKGLYNLQHKVVGTTVTRNDETGEPTISFTIESQAPRGGVMKGGNGNPRGTYSIEENDSVTFGPDDFKIISTQNWTIANDGTLKFDSEIVSNDSTAILPRLGFVMELPDLLDTFTWYGRGPEENYPDRKTGQFVGRYSKPVKEMMTHYTRPQNNGNLEDVRWAELTLNGRGVRFDAPQTMSVTAIPYTEMELFRTDHDYKLPKSDKTVLHLDAKMMGLGGASCGQGGPLVEDRVFGGEHKFGFTISPVSE